MSTKDTKHNLKVTAPVEGTRVNKFQDADLSSSQKLTRDIVDSTLSGSRSITRSKVNEKIKETRRLNSKPETMILPDGDNLTQQELELLNQNSMLNLVKRSFQAGESKLVEDLRIISLNNLQALGAENITKATMGSYTKRLLGSYTDEVRDKMNLGLSLHMIGENILRNQQTFDLWSENIGREIIDCVNQTKDSLESSRDSYEDLANMAIKIATLDRQFVDPELRMSNMQQFAKLSCESLLHAKSLEDVQEVNEEIEQLESDIQVQIVAEGVQNDRDMLQNAEQEREEDFELGIVSKIVAIPNNSKSIQDVALTTLNTQIAPLIDSQFRQLSKKVVHHQASDMVDINAPDFTDLPDQHIVLKGTGNEDQQMVRSIHNAVGTTTFQKFSDSQGDVRQKMVARVMHKLQDTPLQVRDKDRTRYIPSVKFVNSEEDQALLHQVEAGMAKYNKEIKSGGKSLSSAKLKKEIQKSEEEIALNPHAENLYKMYLAMTNKGQAELTTGKQKLKDADAPRNLGDLNSAAAGESIFVDMMRMSLEERRALAKKQKENLRFDPEIDMKKMATDPRAAYKTVQNFISFGLEGRFKDLEQQQLDGVFTYLVGGPLEDILLQKDRPALDAINESAHYQHAKKMMKEIKVKFRESGATDPRQTSARFILEERVDPRHGYVTSRGIDNLVKAGRSTALFSPYATDTFFPRSSNTSYNLLQPYLKKFKDIDKFGNRADNDKLLVTIDQNARDSNMNDSLRYGNIFLYPDTGIREKFIRSGEEFEKSFKELGDDGFYHFMFGDDYDTGVFTASRAVEELRKPISLAKAQRRYIDFNTNNGAMIEGSNDLSLAWQRTYYPLNRILHASLRSGLLFDIAMDDREIGVGENYFEGDQAIFKGRLKRDGFFIVDKEEDQDVAEGLISDRQLELFNRRCRVIEGDRTARHEKQYNLNAREIQAGLRVAAAHTICDALIGDYELPVIEDEVASANAENDAAHNHRLAIMRALAISQHDPTKLTAGQNQWAKHNFLAQPGGHGLLASYLSLIQKSLAEDLVSMPVSADWQRETGKRLDPLFFQRNRVPMYPEIGAVFGHVSAMARIDSMQKSLFLSMNENTDASDEFEYNLSIDQIDEMDKSRAFKDEFTKLPGMSEKDGDFQSYANRPIFQVLPFLKQITKLAADEDDSFKSLYMYTPQFLNTERKKRTLERVKNEQKKRLATIADYEQRLTLPDEEKIFGQKQVATRSKTHDELKQELITLRAEEAKLAERGGIEGKLERIKRKEEIAKRLNTKPGLQESKDFMELNRTPQNFFANFNGMLAEFFGEDDKVPEAYGNLSSDERKKIRDRMKKMGESNFEDDIELKKYLSDIIQDDLSYCSRCGTEDIRKFGDFASREKTGFNFTMCCGMPIHQECLEAQGSESSSLKIPGAQYSCFNCGFGPVGLVRNRGDSISSIRASQNLPFDAFRESTAWGSRVAEAAKASAEPLFYGAWMYQDAMDLMRDSHPGTRVGADLGERTRLGEMRFTDPSTKQFRLPITVMQKERFNKKVGVENAADVSIVNEPYQVILGNNIQGIIPTDIHQDNIIGQYNLFMKNATVVNKGLLDKETLFSEFAIGALSEKVQVLKEQRRGFGKFVQLYFGDYLSFVTNPQVFLQTKDLMFYSPFNKTTNTFGSTPAEKMTSIANNILQNGLLNPHAPKYGADPYVIEEEEVIAPQKRNNRRLAIQEDPEMEEEVKADGGPPVDSPSPAVFQFAAAVASKESDEHQIDTINGNPKTPLMKAATNPDVEMQAPLPKVVTPQSSAPVAPPTSVAPIINEMRPPPQPMVKLKSKGGGGIKLTSMSTDETEKLKKADEELRQATYDPKRDHLNIAYTKAAAASEEGYIKQTLADAEKKKRREEKKKNLSSLNDEELMNDTQKIIDDGLEQTELVNNLAVQNAQTFASQKLNEEAEKTKEKEDDINLEFVADELWKRYVKPKNKPQQEEKKQEEEKKSSPPRQAPSSNDTKGGGDQDMKDDSAKPQPKKKGRADGSPGGGNDPSSSESDRSIGRARGAGKEKTEDMKKLLRKIEKLKQKMKDEADSYTEIIKGLNEEVGVTVEQRKKIDILEADQAVRIDQITTANAEIEILREEIKDHEAKTSVLTATNKSLQDKIQRGGHMTSNQHQAEMAELKRKNDEALSTKEHAIRQLEIDIQTRDQKLQLQEQQQKIRNQQAGFDLEESKKKIKDLEDKYAEEKKVIKEEIEEELKDKYKTYYKDKAYKKAYENAMDDFKLKNIEVESQSQVLKATREQLEKQLVETKKLLAKAIQDVEKDVGARVEEELESERPQKEKQWRVIFELEYEKRVLKKQLELDRAKADAEKSQKEYDGYKKLYEELQEGVEELEAEKRALNIKKSTFEGEKANLRSKELLFQTEYQNLKQDEVNKRRQFEMKQRAELDEKVELLVKGRKNTFPLQHFQQEVGRASLEESFDKVITKYGNEIDIMDKKARDFKITMKKLETSKQAQGGFMTYLNNIRKSMDLTSIDYPTYEDYIKYTDPGLVADQAQQMRNTKDALAKKLISSQQLHQRVTETLAEYQDTQNKFQVKTVALDPLYQKIRALDQNLPVSMKDASDADWSNAIHNVKMLQTQNSNEESRLRIQLDQFQQLDQKLSSYEKFSEEFNLQASNFVTKYEEFKGAATGVPFTFAPLTMDMRTGRSKTTVSADTMGDLVDLVRQEMYEEAQKIEVKKRMMDAYKTDARELSELSKQIYNHSLSLKNINAAMNSETIHMYGMFQQAQTPRSILNRLDQSWNELDQRTETTQLESASRRKLYAQETLDLAKKFESQTQMIAQEAKQNLDVVYKSVEQMRAQREKISRLDLLAAEEAKTVGLQAPTFERAMEIQRTQQRNVGGSFAELEGALIFYQGFVKQEEKKVKERIARLTLDEDRVKTKVYQLKDAFQELGEQKGKVKDQKKQFEEIIKQAHYEHQYERLQNGQAVQSIDAIIRGGQGFDEQQEINYIKRASTGAVEAITEQKLKLQELSREVTILKQSSKSREEYREKMEELNIRAAEIREQNIMIQNACVIADNYNKYLNRPEDIPAEDRQKIENEMRKYGVTPTVDLDEMSRDMVTFVRNNQQHFDETRYDSVLSIVGGETHERFMNGVHNIFAQASLIESPHLQEQKERILAYTANLCRNRAFNESKISTAYNRVKPGGPGAEMNVAEVLYQEEQLNRRYERSLTNLNSVHSTVPQLQKMVRDLYRIELQISATSNISERSRQKVRDAFQDSQSGISVALESVVSQFSRIREQQSNPYTDTAMGIGSEAVMGTMKALQTCEAEVQSLVKYAFKDETHRKMEEVTKQLSNRIVESLNQQRPTDVMQKEYARFGEMEDLKEHLRELFINSFTIDKGQNLNSISRNFVDGVKAFRSLDQNTTAEIERNTRQLLVAFSNTFRPEIIQACVNIHSKNIKPVLEKLNEKGIEGLIMGNINAVTKGGLRNMEHINQTYIERSRSIYQTSIKDYNAFMDTVNGIRIQMIEYHGDNLVRSKSYDDTRMEMGLTAKQEVQQKRETGQFGTTIFGMGASITGYQQGSLMRDLSRHIEMHTVKRETSKFQTVEEHKHMGQKIEMMKRDLEEKRETVGQTLVNFESFNIDVEEQNEFRQTLALHFIPAIGTSGAARLRRAFAQGIADDDDDHTIYCGQVIAIQHDLASYVIAPAQTTIESNEMISMNEIRRLQCMQHEIEIAHRELAAVAREIEQIARYDQSLNYEDEFFSIARERYSDDDTVKQLGNYMEDPAMAATTARNSIDYLQKTIERIRTQDLEILDHNYERLDETLAMIQEQQDGLLRMQQMNQARDKYVNQVENSITDMLTKLGLGDALKHLKDVHADMKEAAESTFPKIVHNSGGGNVGGSFRSGGGGFGGYAPGISPVYQSGQPGQSRPMMAYPNSQAVRGIPQGSQGGTDGNTPDANNAKRSRLSEKVFGAAGKVGKLSSDDLKMLKRLRFDESTKRLKLSTLEGGERDLTEEEKKRVIKLIIKMIVSLYAMTMKSMTAEEKEIAQKEMNAKLRSNPNENQPGNLIGMLNKLADKYVARDQDGDVIMR